MKAIRLTPTQLHLLRYLNHDRIELTTRGRNTKIVAEIDYALGEMFCKLDEKEVDDEQR